MVDLGFIFYKMILFADTRVMENRKVLAKNSNVAGSFEFHRQMMVCHETFLHQEPVPKNYDDMNWYKSCEVNRAWKIQWNRTAFISVVMAFTHLECTLRVSRNLSCG